MMTVAYEEPQPYVYQAWPAWRYGPNGAAQIFNDETEVPPGWVDDPAKLVEPAAEPEQGAPRLGRPPKAVTEEQF